MTLVRFAPSPTGKLHVGNVRAALFNYLFAQQTEGKFLLRLDDTDTGRSSEAFAQGIYADLEWLGLKYDLFARQSDRLERYMAAVERLKAVGRLYPCYETPEELERKRRLQLARGLPPMYDRAALKLADLERAKLEEEGRRAHWRFRLDGRHVHFKDLIRGEQSIDTASNSDPVLVRADGSYLYTLPSVVDDIEFGVTHVIRGEDHVTNTGAQVELFEALGTKPPQFAHYPLLTDAEGKKLSKRLEALSIEQLRLDGFERMAVLSLLAHLGTSDPVVPYTDMAPLIAGFSLDKIGRAPARFDEKELLALNARILHQTSFSQVASRLAALGIGGGEAFWHAVRPNLERLSETTRWWQVVEGPFEGAIVDKALCAKAADLLPPEPWDEGTWAVWTEGVKGATGKKGKDLYQPLRLALTGLGHGPEMKSLLPLMRRERVLRLLRGESVS